MPLRHRTRPPLPPLVICDGTSSVNIHPNSRRFGFFSDNSIRIIPNLDTFTTLFGVPPAYILWFQQIDDPFPENVVSLNAAGTSALLSALI